MMVSIAWNSNLISFQSSQATANSGDHLAASRITSLPSRAAAFVTGWMQASRATRLAVAPELYKEGDRGATTDAGSRIIAKNLQHAGICQM